MKLKKLLIIILIILTTNLFADKKDELLKEALVQLEQTTKLLELYKGRVLSLEKENSGLKLENQKLTQKLKEANVTLKDNNKILSELKNRILEDQKEIKNLRNKLSTAIDNIQPKTLGRVGLAITYPYGAEVYAGIKIYNLRIFAFSSISGYYDNILHIIVGLGIGLEF